MSLTTASVRPERATRIARATPESSRPPTTAVSASALSGVDQRQRRALLRFLTRRTGSPEEAEDILQDAYARILAVVHPGQIDTLDRYLWRAAMNVMTDHGRSRQRRAHLSETLLVRAEPFAPSAEVVADAQERLALTGAAVTALPPRCAEAFQLRILQGLPFEEVGHAMHISARMAKIYVARTLRSLKDRLDGTPLPAAEVRRPRTRAPGRTPPPSVPTHTAPNSSAPDPIAPRTHENTQVKPAGCPNRGSTSISPCSTPVSLPTPTPSFPGGPAMHNPDATTILKALIEGREPNSLEPLPAGSIVHRADVLRALLAGVAALERVEVRTKRRAALPDNAGRTWSAEEDSRLVTAFKAGEPPQTIAERHSRTLRAIEARLQRMGLLAPEDRVTRGGFGSEP
jgi:RNA polymerase sigma-70 factor (ECF subfamily)